MPITTPVRSHTRGNPYSFFKKLKVNSDYSVSGITQRASRVRQPRNPFAGMNEDIVYGRNAGSTSGAESIALVFMDGVARGIIDDDAVITTSEILSPSSDRYYWIKENASGSTICGAFIFNYGSKTIYDFVLVGSSNNVANVRGVLFKFLKEMFGALGSGYRVYLKVNNSDTNLIGIAKTVGFRATSTGSMKTTLAFSTSYFVPSVRASPIESGRVEELV
jgi:hypothetical protein